MTGDRETRQSNMELFRCVLMLCVLTVHYNSWDMGKAFAGASGANLTVLYFVESLAILSVNGFVLLAGYFGYRRTKVSLRKPVGLLLTVIGYNLLFYLGEIRVGLSFLDPYAVFTKCIPNNWYVILYVTLILISPFLNVVVRELSQKQMQRLLVITFVLFSVWSTVLDWGQAWLGIPVTGVSTVSIGGAEAGYSIVNFVLLYFIGAYIGKYGGMQYGKGWDLLFYLLCALVIFLGSLINTTVWEYSCMFVILESFFLFNFFRKLSLKSRWINFLALGTFGVYLISTQWFVLGWGWLKFHIPEAAAGSIPLMLAHWILTVTVTFVGCAFFDIMCRKIMTPASRLLDRIGILNQPLVDVSKEVKDKENQHE